MEIREADKHMYFPDKTWKRVQSLILVHGSIIRIQCITKREEQPPGDRHQHYQVVLWQHTAHGCKFNEQTAGKRLGLTDRNVGVFNQAMQGMIFLRTSTLQ